MAVSITLEPMAGSRPSLCISSGIAKPTVAPTSRLSSIAPVIIINKTVHGKMTSDHLMKEMKTLKAGETG